MLMAMGVLTSRRISTTLKKPRHMTAACEYASLSSGDSPTYSSRLKVAQCLKLTAPSLCSAVKRLYTPSACPAAAGIAMTKSGFSGVGTKLVRMVFAAGRCLHARGEGGRVCVGVSLCFGGLLR